MQSNNIDGNISMKLAVNGTKWKGMNYRSFEKGAEILDRFAQE